MGRRLGGDCIHRRPPRSLQPPRSTLLNLAELQAQLSAMPFHCALAFDTQDLFHVSLVMAIGYCMAYDAAVAAGMDAAVVALYEASCIKADSAIRREHRYHASRRQGDRSSCDGGGVLALGGILEGVGLGAVCVMSTSCRRSLPGLGG